jgi:hypothetical protein
MRGFYRRRDGMTPAYVERMAKQRADKTSRQARPKVDAPGKRHRQPAPSAPGAKHSDERIAKLKAANESRHGRHFRG